jgi:hypothetical protein
VNTEAQTTIKKKESNIPSMRFLSQRAHVRIVSISSDKHKETMPIHDPNMYANMHAPWLVPGQKRKHIVIVDVAKGKYLVKRNSKSIAFFGANQKTDTSKVKVKK